MQQPAKGKTYAVVSQPPTAQGQSRESFLVALRRKLKLRWLVFGVPQTRRPARVMQPPAGLGQSKTLRQLLCQEIRWLIFGFPQPRRRGSWVYNSKDKVWRYYLTEWVTE